MDGWQRRYRLNNCPGGLGVSCTGEGVALAGVPLLVKGARGFQPRPGTEVEALLRRAYAGAEQGAAILPGLAKIADALNRGDLAQAMIRAVHLRLPELDWDAAVRLARANDNLAKYSPDQLRDDGGRFADEGRARNGARAPLEVKPKASNGRGAPAKSAVPAAPSPRICGVADIDPKTLLQPAAARVLYDKVLAGLREEGLVPKESLYNEIFHQTYTFAPSYAAIGDGMKNPQELGTFDAAKFAASQLKGGRVAGGLTDPETNTSTIYMSAAASGNIAGLQNLTREQMMRFVILHELGHQNQGGHCGVKTDDNPGAECCADDFALSHMKIGG
ncbi:hypothetical protein [Nitrospirillum sp. BR 11163]|uniref:hypothetical protein n=1 Tax=Nitrospirillum sp. BR 11163 TaxID=3104323 RepID=UPI002AFFE4F1|nr:hypothetical protein [Nitrospirillum sp. BR 11163]MEA1674480.1 hypothetical protein [Nitrospirillum sp. BR 11163]